MSKDVKTGEKNTGKVCGWETGEEEFKKTKTKNIYIYIYTNKKEGIRIQDEDFLLLNCSWFKPQGNDS